MAAIREEPSVLTFVRLAPAALDPAIFTGRLVRADNLVSPESVHNLMPRKFLKRYLPSHETLKSRRELRPLGILLDDPFLLHLNRRSVAGGFSVGLFMAFVPLPTQMIMAAAAAVALRVNIVIAVATVWLTNPITMPPIFYFCYRLGTWILNTPQGPRFEPTLDWFWHEMGNIWQPFLLGCLVMAVTSALAGYGLAHLIWRAHVVHHWKRRQTRRPQPKR